jgi:hypothetical protein
MDGYDLENVFPNLETRQIDGVGLRQFAKLLFAEAIEVHSHCVH